MKLHINALLVILLIISFPEDYFSLNEDDSTKTKSISFEFGFWKPLIFGGYTQVREWQNIGQKFHLNEDLGLNKIDVYEFTLVYAISANHRVQFGLNRYFIVGQQLLTQNGFYNGTELKENTTAVIDASRYYKIMLLDYLTIKSDRTEKLQLIFGVSIDAIRFLVDAPYTQTTPRKETFEQFDKQIVPVPIIGLKWNRTIDNRTSFDAEIRGGSWPGINTWYDESGTIKIWQYNFEAFIGITKQMGPIISNLKLNYKLLSLKGESNEDTNEIFIHGLGPEIKISYQL